MRGARRGDALFLTALLILTAWVYAPGIRARQAYDDLWGTLLNPRTRSLTGFWEQVKSPTPPIPTGPALAWYPYRPLAEASFALVRRMGGGTLYVQRAVNVAIHAAAAVLVFVLVRKLVPSADRAFARWAALLFAVHPMAVQAVTYVYQRFVGLEALFAFACFAAYWMGRSRGWRSGWTWAALAAAFLASGCKETAAAIPLILGLVEWVLRDPLEPWRRIAGRWIPFLSVTVFLAVQVARAEAAQKALNPAVWSDVLAFGRWEFLGIQLPLWGHYPRLALWPFPLGFYYDRFAFGIGDHRVIPLLPAILGGVGVAAAAAWVLLGRRRQVLPRLGLALWGGPLVLEGSVFPNLHIAWNFRCYASFLGAGLLFAWGVSRTGRAGRILGVIALSLLAVLARQENRVWAAPDALQRRDVRHAFRDPMCWSVYGMSLLRADARAAERLIAMGFRGSWGSPPLWTAHIRSLLALGRYDQAHVEIRRAMELYPEDPEVLWIAVQEALRVGEPERIERFARQAERASAPGPEIAAWLARRLLEEGEHARAESVLQRHLALYPSRPDLQDLLARARARR